MEFENSHTYSLIHIKQHTGTKTPICKEGWMEYSFDRVFEYDRNSVLFYFHPERNEYTFKTPLSLSVQVTRKARIEKAHEQERIRKHQRCLERIRRDPNTSVAAVRCIRMHFHYIQHLHNFHFTRIAHLYQSLAISLEIPAQECQLYHWNITRMCTLE